MGNIHIHAFIIQLGGNGAAATPAVGIVVCWSTLWLYK